MAPNGSRKAPARPKSSGMDLLNTAAFDSTFENDDDENRLLVRDATLKALPQVKKPGSWDSETTSAASRKPSLGVSPLLKKLPGDLAKAFPNAKPMDDRPQTLRCSHCKRPVAKHAIDKHILDCLTKKQEKQRKKKEAKDARDAAARKADNNNSDDEAETASKTNGLGASKKRKAADSTELDGPKKKKSKKDEAKAKAPRPKAPVDVEKQCGVELPQGGQCARSLTCKSHSMGAKRAVPGRSAPYDKLLMEYQRKNQAKLQKAAFDANAPAPDDDSLPSGPVDSDEEKDAVMQGIDRSWGMGRPIYQPTYVPLKKKYETIRMKGMLQHALGSRSGGSLFGNSGGGTGFFGAPHFAEPMSGIEHVRRGSVVPGARSMVPPASRKASMASAI